MRFVAALLLMLVASQASAEIVREPGGVALVPSVHRGHSAMWKTGAIITAASVGVTLLGAWLTVMGVKQGGLGTCDITEGARCDADPRGAALMGVGIAISVAGDAGLFIGGPATWIAGTHRAVEKE